MTLGERIYKLRKKKGLSQEQLGERINVTRQTISNWELSETNPNPEQLKLLSKELDVSVDELLDNDRHDIILEKTTNTEKLVISTFKLLKLFLILFIMLIITAFIIYSSKSITTKPKDKGRIIDETIICNIYEEEHSFNIKYYELTGEPKEFGSDTYFRDILDLGRYNNAQQIFNIINDYVKKNNGICKKVFNRDLSNIVDMQIKEGTLSKTSATVIIKDNSPNRIIYGSDFYIEKYNNGIWETISPINDNYAFNAMAYYVDANGILEMNHNWDYIYGKLNKGVYRLVKDVFFESDIPVSEEDKYYVWVELIIE